MRYQTLYPQGTGQWRIRRFNCILTAGKGHSAGKPLPQLAIREDAKIFVQNWTKKLFFANKDPKINFDDWMILQKHVLSFKCNDFFKMANLKTISSSATLTSMNLSKILHIPPSCCSQIEKWLVPHNRYEGYQTSLTTALSALSLNTLTTWIVRILISMVFSCLKFAYIITAHIHWHVAKLAVIFN